MFKVINLKAGEDVTSVIEYLWDTGADRVFLVAPKGCQFAKNIVGLKLLKREAERLGKEAILVTKDAVARELAKRIGLPVKAAVPKLQDLEEEDQEIEKAKEEEKEEKSQILNDMPSGRFESLLDRELLKKREAAQAPSGARTFRGMSDIRPKQDIETADRVSIRHHEKEDQIEIQRTPEDIQTETHREVSDEFSRKGFGAEIFESEPEAETDLDDEPDQEVEESHWDDRKHAWKEIFSKKERIEKARPKKSADWTKKILTGFISAAVLIAAVALYFILPKAEISVVPQTQAVSQSVNLLADKSASKADPATARIPAQLIKLDKRESQEFTATGQRQLNEKAKGKVTIYNEYSSSPQALVEKTRLASQDGKIFRLTKSVTVPGAKISEGKIQGSSVEAEVVADQPGEDYNIGPGRFTIPGFQGTPKYDAFYAKSSSAMSGGASGLATVVSQEDYDKAKNTVWQNLKNSLDQEFKAQIPADLKVLPEAQKEEMAEVISTAQPGEKADKFTITIKGTAAAILFDEKDIAKLVQGKLTDKAGAGKSIDQDSRQIAYKEITPDFTRGQLALKTDFSAKVVWDVNSDQLKREIAGKKENEVRQALLNHPELEKVRVMFWPFWVKTVPSSLDKIELNIDKE